MGLRIAGVPEVCGAFFGGILGENPSAGLGDSFVASRSDLSQQGFELGEDLFDRVEVGRVFWQKHEARADVSDRPSHDLSLVGAEVVQDHDVAWLMLRAPIARFALVAERPRSLELRPNRTSMEITIQSSASLQALAGIRVKKMRLGGVERELYGVPLVDSHPLLQHRDDFSLARMRD